jgi:RPA family protein
MNRHEAYLLKEYRAKLESLAAVDEESREKWQAKTIELRDLSRVEPAEDNVEHYRQTASNHANAIGRAQTSRTVLGWFDEMFEVLEVVGR